VIELLRPTRLALTLLTAVLAFSVSAPAFGDPISAKRAQATRVESQIEALNTKAEIATEKYNLANQRHAQLTREVAATEKRIAKLNKRTNKLQSQLNTQANDMYRQGPLGFLGVLLGSTSFENFSATWDLLTKINAQRGDTVAQLRQTKADAEAAHKRLVVAENQAAKQQAAMASNEKAVKQQLAAREQVLSGLNADIKSLIAQKQAQEAAAARALQLALLKRQRAAASAARVAAARAAARARSASAPGPAVTRFGGRGSGSSAPSATGAKAVYWAETALGKPYVWAAAGPDAFDCSGLTMWAYRKAGVSLPHYAASQINYGTRVSRSDLQPGDLVFFGGPIHHVGMYVGGGDFIHAPHTGDVVKISSLSSRSDYAGACRPY
jgi:cell wall-associated NlpC family hydrolase